MVISTEKKLKKLNVLCQIKEVTMPNVLVDVITETMKTVLSMSTLEERQDIELITYEDVVKIASDAIAIEFLKRRIRNTLFND